MGRRGKGFVWGFRRGADGLGRGWSRELRGFTRETRGFPTGQ